MLKSYIVSFNGHYLPGSMIIVAETKRKAFNRAVKELDFMGLSKKNIAFNASDLEEIDTTNEQSLIIWDGDY